MSNHDLGTAGNAHVTLSSPACHESTKPGAFFLLWGCRASLQPRRSGPFRIRPSFVHVPSHPRSSLVHPHAEVAATHVLTSSQASLRRHVRRLSSFVEPHVPRLPKQTERKITKEKNVEDGDPRVVQTCYVDEDEKIACVPSMDGDVVTGLLVVRVWRWLVVWYVREDLFVARSTFRPRVVARSLLQSSLVVWRSRPRLPSPSRIVRSAPSQRQRFRSPSTPRRSHTSQ